MRELWELREIVWRNRWRYAAGLLSVLLVDLLQLAIPKVLERVTDALKSGQAGPRFLLWHIGLLLVLATGIFVFRYFWRWFVFGVARTIEYELRNRLMAHYLHLDAAWHQQRKVGDLMAHATNDIPLVRFAFGGGMVMAVDAAILISLTVFMMAFTIDAKLTAVALLPMPLLAAVALFFGRAVHRRTREAQEAFSHLTDEVQEALSGLRVLKAFALEAQMQRRFAAVAESARNRNLAVARVQALFQPLVQLLFGLSLLLTLAYGGALVIRGVITLGEFVAFTAYLGLLTWPMLAIGWMINVFQRGAAAMARLNAIFAERPTVRDDARAVTKAAEGGKTDPGKENAVVAAREAGAVQGAAFPRLRGEIVIRHLTFTYPQAEEPALRDVSLTIPAGARVGIVGRTGSGKTTLVNLLARLYDVPEGTIWIDGREIHTIPLAVLRRNIAVVPQDHFLFSDTIRGNVVYGVDAWTEDAVQAAVQAAQLQRDLAAFPEGLETVVGERGVALSGGQKQRVAIARALLKDAPILILDDALSAVDAETETALLESLRPLMHGRTTIIVAHRLSAVRDCDKIVVLDEGRVVEEGTHEELLARGGLYRQLYETQQLEAQVDAESADVPDEVSVGQKEVSR
ncbi:ABC transporter ATP-binding protein [Calditerricola satsumensis]|uniref:ABC transporter ATP-binding protein n=1 Tax=Calditerricola satsumensis TaxID=373054 RepID=A0A8J3B951_9BACI|nr:ABC transporter ATP-binding protein [Calditerricola satsumensis]GGK04626.1 ABC transporter ATP-binding protein [Calditerricola satsumensis]